MIQVGENVWQICAGEFPVNSYVWIGPSSNSCILIDAGLDADPLEAALLELGVRPRAVFCTHGHFDHIGTASFFQDKYSADIYIHSADVKTAKTANFLMMAYKMRARVKLPVFTLLDGNEGETSIDGVIVRHRLLPGHTGGSCFIEIGLNSFTGDTLYRSGVGLSKIPGEQPDVLRRSLQSVWDKLDPNTLICPGHGSVGTFGEISKRNKKLIEFINLRDSEAAA